MRKCPKCQNWTLDFDEYFGRFRCYDAECGWMPPSTAEREIRLLRNHEQPTKIELESKEIPELGMKLTPYYDIENDALSFDFGSEEPTIDLPDPDGRMIWKIGRNSENVTGFTIIGAKKWSISHIGIQFIIRRKNDIERGLRRIPITLIGGRATKDLIEAVIVMAVTEDAHSGTNVEDDQFFKEVESKLEELTNK